jgi:murein DD-endopeptidase MepM/ murein hydrolase activator NlpD
MRIRSGRAIALLFLVIVVALPGSVRASDPSPAAPSPIFGAPAHYRPVVVGGKAFPLARSNYLSLIAIECDWHAPRLRLIGGTWRLVGVHEGIDIYAEPGTPVVSMTAGTVQNSGWAFYSGNRVTILGPDGRSYFYAHLSSIERGIIPGARVSAGTLLGRSGNTGYGPLGERDQFPPHLHLGIEEGGTWVDPLGTLVSLYRATLAADQREQGALDRLAAAGNTAGWHTMAGTVYLDPATG